MEEKSFDYINVIPLVDVMLVLLTIVLTGATFIVSGSLPVQLPKAQSSQSEIARAQVIEIDAAGSICMNRERVDREGLRDRLEKIDRTAPFVIKADAQCALQAFVDVFDCLNLLGFTHIDLQTEKTK